MKLRFSCLSLVLASAAFGQGALFKIEVDGTPGAAAVARPGSVIYIDWKPGIPNLTPYFGLASCTFQPTITGLTAGDMVGVINSGGGVSPFGSVGGRVTPFATPPMNTGSPSGALTAFNDPGNVLRLAGANAITPLTNLAWGVSVGQNPPIMEPSRQPKVVRICIMIDPVPTPPRMIIANAPLNFILNQRLRYYTSAAGAAVNVTLGPNDILPLTIQVVPCSGTCPADVDDGGGLGIPDGGVGIEDLLHYLATFNEGGLCADVDDGSATGTRDGGVTIEDILYYLGRFDAGC